MSEVRKFARVLLIILIQLPIIGIAINGAVFVVTAFVLPVPITSIVPVYETSVVAAKVTHYQDPYAPAIIMTLWIAVVIFVSLILVLRRPSPHV